MPLVNSTTKKALIIDDEPIINRLNKKILNGIKIECDCRNSLDCLQGENITRITDYNIIIIDLNLLKRNDEKIIEKIRSQNDTIPVLITSGYLKESAYEILKKCSRVGYIQKPYTINDFIEGVKNLLEA
ncbi:MAG: response regulator [Candidatus Aureabacteria bacterium]|nr:response regulator [Candidatus Auribacterota bacterium]